MSSSTGVHYTWFIELVTHHPDHDAAFYLQKVFPLLLLCVPDEKQELAKEQMEELQSDIWKQLWEGSANRVFQITLTLGLGLANQA